MSYRLRAIVVVLLSALTSTLAAAAGLGFLQETPLAYFTDRDRELLREAATAVLKDPDAAAVREWMNPQNNYSGKIEGLGAYTASDGAPCRKLRISTQARGVQNVASYSVCRTADGDWKIAVRPR